MVQGPVAPHLERLRLWAHEIRRDVVAIYFAARDTRTPLVARVLGWGVAAYALSPIDLIPDFVPILGHLDDLLIVPLTLMVVIRMLPHDVLLDSRAKASALLARPASHAAATAIVVLWLGGAAALVYWWYHR